MNGETIDLRCVLAAAPPFPGLKLLAALSRGHDLDVFDVWCSHRRTRCILKTVRPDRVDDEAIVRRLGQEAALLMRLTHPHIVRAYATGALPLPHLVEETLTGHTLGALLAQKGGLGRPEVLHLADHLSSALSYLHDEGVLHLDLKPANIVAEAGRAKIIDFSLAHGPGDDGPPGWGTRRYLAPEQARGGDFTAATDVWGLGMVLHEAATGQKVFPGETPLDEGDEDYYPQLTKTAPSLRTQRRLPPKFRGVIEQCLEPDPAARPTLEEVRAVIDKFIG